MTTSCNGHHHIARIRQVASKYSYGGPDGRQSIETSNCGSFHEITRDNNADDPPSDQVHQDETIQKCRLKFELEKVDRSFHKDFGLQTIIYRLNGTTSQSRNTSRHFQVEQPEYRDMAHRSQQSALETYKIIQSFQGTTSNTLSSCNGDSISSVPGRGAVAFSLIPVDHSIMSQLREKPRNGSPLSISLKADRSPSGAHTDETSFDKISEKLSIQSQDTISQSYMHDLGVKDMPVIQNVDRQLSNELFFLHPKDWATKKAKPIVRKLLPLNFSLCQSYLHGKKLGKGGCAKVKLCKVDKKQMVVKKSSRFSINSFFPACEVAVMKALVHPNIVRYHSASRWLSDTYIAMEYIDGCDLSQITSRKGEHDVPESVVATVMREVLKGLAYTHDQHYAHCDIKPENIFLSRDGEVKIGDFGVAKDIRVYDAVVTWGTDEFKPPELLRSREVDIWALGTSALEVFAGFVERECVSFIDAHGEPSMDYIPIIPWDLSDEFREFLILALKPNQSERATALELLDLPFIKNAPPTYTLIPIIEKSLKS